ncbi:zinc-dependent peptidase [Shewanella aestuarii]|uniref:Zinc-dependent peptidase n=1 Tax=Shewanella aestuarii TaxID=1028752 RepID=A0A6G9QIJ8_9GAMM|nr:M90 family metallopeptidase [Shewanella aestuarii]QIR13887.1 zinc-dependent peptidase [Shewanella aestuarii]
MLTLIILILIAVGWMSWIATSQYRQDRHRQQICATPFPKAWRNILRQRFPYFQAMPTDLQLQLKKHIQVFIDEKTFIGCDNLVITDEIKVTIAAQACLLLLNRKTNYYPQLKQILVYPHAFIVEQQKVDFAGVTSQHRSVLLGESWGDGKVILSWQNTLKNAAEPYNGQNVVIHEFAHQLDQENGPANGAPTLRQIKDYASWSETLGNEFKQLQYCAAQQIPSLFSYYGATNPAEFFAVISETFFEKPHEFSKLHPSLYNELSQYYQLNPIHWH